MEADRYAHSRTLAQRLHTHRRERVSIKTLFFLPPLALSFALALRMTHTQLSLSLSPFSLLLLFPAATQRLERKGTNMNDRLPPPPHRPTEQNKKNLSNSPQTKRGKAKAKTKAVRPQLKADNPLCGKSSLISAEEYRTGIGIYRYLPRRTLHHISGHHQHHHHQQFLIEHTFFHGWRPLDRELLRSIPRLGCEGGATKAESPSRSGMKDPDCPPPLHHRRLNHGRPAAGGENNSKRTGRFSEPS